MKRDVVVVGAGPAGIAAASRAAEAGRSVLLLDENPDIGGQIWRHRIDEPIPNLANRWIARLHASTVSVLRGASVVDVHDDGDGFIVTVEHNGVPALVNARALVLATGARERFLPFPGWTLPGVIGIGGAQAMLKSGLSFAHKRVVIAGSGPLLLPVAGALTSNGARVLLVAEQAPRRAVATFAVGLWKRPNMLLQATRYRLAFRSAPYRLGEWIVAARGGGRVEEVDISNGASTRTIACDVLCSAFGLVPNVELASLMRCAISRGSVIVDDRQQTSRPRVFCAGESTGIGGVDLSLVEGEIAGMSAAGVPLALGPLGTQRDRLRSMAEVMERTFALRAELRTLGSPDTIVCRCEDVALGALDPRWTMRQAKLYARAGMGPCQGRVCGAALEFLYQWQADVVRLPCEPAMVSTLIAEATSVAPPNPHGA